MIIRVIDFETTGTGDDAEVIEVAAVDFEPGEAPLIVDAKSALVKPSNPIPPEASAIHHVTNDMVVGAASWDEAWAGIGAVDSDGIRSYAAHSAEFEGRFAPESLRGGLPLVCSYKSALRVWPDAPGFGNQTLRYWLKLDLDQSLAMPPHRALPDAFVTAHILNEILKAAPLEDLMLWSSEPAVLPKISFGKHAGSPWTDVPSDYLDWIVNKSDLDAAVKWNAGRELGRGRGAVRAAYVDACMEAVAMCGTVESLMAWFTGEAERRHAHGVEKGSEDYKRIVDACAARKAAVTGNSP